MIDNDLIQTAILLKSQSVTALTASLPSGTASIKEFNWKGTDFQYPCVRIAVESQFDLTETNVSCPSQVDFSFYIFSEKQSSKEANQIAGKVVTGFRGLSFSQNSIKFVKVRVLEHIPAIAEDERTWRAQVRCQSVVHAS